MDAKTWKSINIADIFKISYGNKLDMCDMTPQKGGIAFVTRTSKNNGIGGYVAKLEDEEPYPPKCLTVALGGSIGSTFLQEQPFYTSQNVAVLEPSCRLSDEILLAIATLIKKECDKRFIAFGRELNKHINKDFTIKLPIAEDGQPDWPALRYWLNSVVIPKLPRKTKEIWNGMQMNKSLLPNEICLGDRKWDWFKISSLFRINAGKRYDEEMYSEGDTPYCSATADDNGIWKFIDLPSDFQGNKITIGKIKCPTFYQLSPFCATNDVNILTPKFRMTPFIGLFITSVIKFSEGYRWNYGRQCRVNDTKNIKIKLPVDSNGNPDWQFIEDYIKSLPYSANL